MMTQNSITDDDLLLAVRYALNECDPAELAAFEARLGDDPSAQVALVEAVQIVALLQSTPTCEAITPRLARRVSARRTWQVASLLAATLLVAVIAVWQSVPSSRIDHTVAMSNDSPVLAQAWTALDSPASTTDDADEASSVDDSADDSANEIASDVPDWLLAAVIAEAEQGQPDDPDMDLVEETQL